MTKTRAHIIVSGRVQGVGFRYTTQQIANEVGVYGWVKNLPEGSVEIEAEGEVEKVYQFIDAIKANPSRFARVDDVELSIYDELKNYQSFDIAH